VLTGGGWGHQNRDPCHPAAPPSMRRAFMNCTWVTN